MLLHNKSVAIVGAGPVGLTMANLLQQKGVNVKVYERDKGRYTRITGGTLDLHKGSGQDALQQAGLLENYYSMAMPMGRIVADKDGNVLRSNNAKPEERYDNPEINRNDLRTILLNSLQNDTVVWNKKFSGLNEENGQWLLQFEDGSTAIADIFIGANGGMTKARNYLTDAIIEYTGSIIIQGNVAEPTSNCPQFLDLCNNNILMAASDGNMFVANPKNGDLLSYSVIFKQPNDFNTTADDITGIKNFLLNRLSTWNEYYKELIHSTISFVIWKTRKISLDEKWKSNRPLPITLIGDAAHKMPPFAGQGVNTGLMDAMILATNLTSGKFKSINEAIADYETQMFVYAREAQMQTSINEKKMMHSDFSFLNFGNS